MGVSGASAYLPVDPGRIRADSFPIVTEAEGTALLLARFTEAGYSIAENFHFHEGDIEVDLDGWDAAARVGYEYLTPVSYTHLSWQVPVHEARVHAASSDHAPSPLRRCAVRQ